ncbi:unnamed protein product (mitochondrion) [Plasmodiophora brassicae]|uniref:Uncharacterized protein n=1 Tax=Plasmodiophora brassicae TaxID=37360 RepID=A0A0G4IGL6_PLABS|nr:hypothetical protein PBRA_000035 [Plasmodiophora brassicae]SPQ96612.1 unnamed protein product [Plasmodiophora brassicae]
MLDTFIPPNLEDPVEDGEYKSVFKDALFEPVFGDRIVVFKVSRDERDDRLSTISREVQIAAVCRKLQHEFNAVAPDTYHVEFSDCCAIELLPDSIETTLKSEDDILVRRVHFYYNVMGVHFGATLPERP